MGAEREDTDPNQRRAVTEPGLGRSSSNQAAAAVSVEEEAPPPVDFDALHAALGDPIDYEELPSGPAIDQGIGDDDLFDPAPPIPAPPAGRGARGGDSSGRSSATYASARPHTIPPTRAPMEDLNAPPVIVASDDTVPSAPPQMTVPLMPANPNPAFGMTIPTSPRPPGAGSSGQQHVVAGHPSSGAHVANAAGGFLHTPPPFPVQPRGAPQMTMRMPDRPVNPRRAKTPTLVVRARGPSAKQKLVVFMAMLLLVTGSSIAMIIWRKPRWLGLEPMPSPAVTSPLPTPVGTLGASSAGAAAASPVTPVAPASNAAAAATSASSSASSANAKKPPVKTAPPPASALR